MSKAFKKKKEQQSVDDISNKLNFLLGSQLLQNGEPESVKLQRSLILKSAMFWDTKSRIQRIKSLMLSNLGLQDFEDVDDFKIQELTSIELLCLSKNKIIHLQPLIVLDTLVTLNINHNKVYDLSPLSQLLQLQELFASNNQISNIDSLKVLDKLRVLKLYKNKISIFESTYSTLQKLSSLEELDVEENPFFNEEVRKQLILLPITTINEQLISKAEKDSFTAGNKSIINMSSSCMINPLNMSMMRDTKTSFFNASNGSIKRNKKKEFKEQLDQLQDEYMKIDDQFQEQIVLNVSLKSEYHRILQTNRQNQTKKEENQYKTQQIQLLKRKAKDLKQNLFTKDKKGELLRKLFQLQTQTISRQPDKKQIKRSVVWTRRFDCDDVIVIQDDNHYLQQDSELAALLQNNSNTLQQLRRELQSMY